MQQKSVYHTALRTKIRLVSVVHVYRERLNCNGCSGFLYNVLLFFLLKFGTQWGGNK